MLSPSEVLRERIEELVQDKIFNNYGDLKGFAESGFDDGTVKVAVQSGFLRDDNIAHYLYLVRTFACFPIPIFQKIPLC